MAKEVIHIYGASGSGTTTLAKYLRDQRGFFFMDSDDYYWLPVEPPYTRKRNPEERLRLMRQDIDRAEKAVISGSLTGWGDELIPLFTLAVRLETDTDIRIRAIPTRDIPTRDIRIRATRIRITGIRERFSQTRRQRPGRQYARNAVRLFRQEQSSVCPAVRSWLQMRHSVRIVANRCRRGRNSALSAEAKYNDALCKK